MILDSNTSLEMINEMDAEQREVGVAVDRYAITNLMPLHRKKQLKIPCVRWMEYTSKRHNRYLIKMIILNTSDLKYPHYTHYLVFDSEVGKKVLLPLFIQPDMPRYVMEFEPHLFKRYAERMGIDKHGTDLIKAFFNNNNELYRTDGFSRKGGNERDIMLMCYDGAVFGEFYDDNGVMMKTFIDTDSMGGPRAILNAKYNDLVEQCRKGYEAEYLSGKRGMNDEG